MATGGKNLALKYSPKVDERFSRESQLAMALNKDYEFNGVDTVKVYSIPTVPMRDYQRSGLNRYGTPSDLARNVQTLKLNRDRCFSFIIDRGDKIQSQMVSDAGKALSRQTREACIPEYDTYGFQKLASEATARNNFASTALTKSNAYEHLLAGQERLGDRNVPDRGRICFASYRFANLLKQDSAFMRYSNMSQEMLVKGVMGEVDGTKIVKVPASRLPAGAAFLLTHPCAAVGPKQLESYRTHEDPPGINGWLCEGRLIYDVFVLDGKADAIYYHGSQGALKPLNVVTAATDTAKTSIVMQPGEHNVGGAKWYYAVATDYTGLPAVTYGTAISTGDWTELHVNGEEVTPGISGGVIRVIEVNADNEPIASGDAMLHIG